MFASKSLSFSRGKRIIHNSLQAKRPKGPSGREGRGDSAYCFSAILFTIWLIKVDSNIQLFHPFLLDNELRQITIEMNPSFRHFLSITLVICRLRSDRLRWRMTDGGMNGEERDGRLGRPKWLSIREQLFIAREHRSWTSTSCCGVHILVTLAATAVHPSSVTIIRYHVSYCLSATFATVTDATDFYNLDGNTLPAPLFFLRCTHLWNSS